MRGVRSQVDRRTGNRRIRFALSRPAPTKIGIRVSSMIFCRRALFALVLSARVDRCNTLATASAAGCDTCLMRRCRRPWAVGEPETPLSRS